MQLTELKEYQTRLEQQLEDAGLTVSYGDEMSVLLETYEAATGTGYVQLPFVVDAREANSYNFWVAFDDGNQPVALTGYRTLRNGAAPRRVGQAFYDGVLYAQLKKEGWWPQSGPMLAPHELYGYIGAGWVHPRFRGHNLAGYIARVAQVEAILRTGGELGISTAMTTEPLFKSGMNLRASGLHHMHVEQVLQGYFQVVDKDGLLYVSHSTNDELLRFYEVELALLRNGEEIPWLHGHDKSHADAVLALGKARNAEPSTPAPTDTPISSFAALS